MIKEYQKLLRSTRREQKKLLELIELLTPPIDGEYYEIIKAEKETPFALTLKFSQQHMKWVECEMAILRDIAKLRDNENVEATDIDETDREIITDFIKRQES